MRGAIPWRILWLLPVVLLMGLESIAAADGWKAGAAKEKITPQAPMWMAGYGSRNHPATGLLNDLYAKVLVLEDPRGERAVVLTLDLVGISPDLVDPLVAQLKDKYRLARANVAICCSHTHSGPVVGHNLRTLHYDLVDDAQRQLIDRYAQELLAKLVALVGQGIARLQPSQLAWGQGTATFAANRRNNKEADIEQLRSENKLVGPFDHDVPILRITNAAGQITAILFGYACHATVLDGYDWSSDYPGFAQAALEQRHPDAVALFFAGCGADQNPLPRRKVELASRYGTTLADAVDAALQSPLKAVVGNLAASFVQVPLELATVPSQAQIDQDVQSADRYVAARAKLYRDRLHAGEAISATYAYPIQVWRLGSELRLVALAQPELALHGELGLCERERCPAHRWAGLNAGCRRPLGPGCCPWGRSGRRLRPANQAGTCPTPRVDRGLCE